MEKDPAIFEEINYYVTCHLIFPTISSIYIVKRVILLAVIHMSLLVLVCLRLIKKMLETVFATRSPVFSHVPQKLRSETDEEFPVCLTCLRVLTQ